jgi:hypothetical protein
MVPVPRWDMERAEEQELPVDTDKGTDKDKAVVADNTDK